MRWNHNLLEGGCCNKTRNTHRLILMWVSVGQLGFSVEGGRLLYAVIHITFPVVGNLPINVNKC